MSNLRSSSKLMPMTPLPYMSQNGRQFFYCNGKLSAELNGDTRWRFLRANGLVLVQKDNKASGLPSMLTACDQQRSVLSICERKRPESQAYSPYGHHTQGSGLLSLLAFNGERPDAVTGRYHLGNGYRQYSPVMMRFCSPDSWSPFGAGGFNAYVYCAGDPTNRSDPTGHFWGIQKFFRRLFGMKAKSPKPAKTVAPAVKEGAAQFKRVDSLTQNTGQTPDDAKAFESLFTDHEVAEQFQLFEAFEVPGRSTAATIGSRVQILGSSPDVAAGNRYRQNLGEYRRRLTEESRARSLDALTVGLGQVRTRMAGAGSSRDVMIERVLQEQIRKRVD